MNEDNNAINEQLHDIDNNLTKLEKHSLRIRDNVGLIWLIISKVYFYMLLLQNYLNLQQSFQVGQVDP